MRLHPPPLMLITDHQLAGDQLLSRVSACLQAARPGSVAVQLRDRQLSARRRLDLGYALRAECQRWAQYLVVNDRVDLALLLGADGVHLPGVGVSPAEARGLAPSLWLSAACHPSLATSTPRCPEGVDAWLVSPVISPRKGRPALGVAGLAALGAQLTAQPIGATAKAPPAVYALGGVDAASAAGCLAHGADGVALIGAALDGRPIAPLLAALGIAR